MDEIFHCLGINSRIQQEAVRLLACSGHRFMRSDLFRKRLAVSLAQAGFGAVFIKKINSGIEALVEQQLLMRRVKASKVEIGLNQEIWKLSSETIGLIREATTSVAESMFIDSDFGHAVHDVKKRFRKLGGVRGRISDTAFDMLVARFLTPGSLVK